MSKFTTVIPTYGPGGNIFEIVGRARVLMRQLKVPNAEIEAMCKRVSSATSYEEACGVVREWFPLEGDEED